MPKTRWLRQILGALRPNLAEIVFTSLFINLLALAVPVFVLQVYDRVVFFSGISTLQGLAIGMLFAIAFDFAFRQARSRLLQRVALRFDLELGKRLFDKLTATPLRTLETRPSAFWHALYRDVELVRNTFSGPTAVLIADLPFAVIFLAFLFIIALPVAWVLVVILPVFLLLAWRAAVVLRRANEKEREAALGRDFLITDLVNGRTTIKALSTAAAVRPMWEERHIRTIESSIVRGGLTDRYVNLGLALTVLTTVAITSVGALAIMEQRLTIGALIAANILSFRIVAPFQQLVANWRALVGAREAANRLGEVFSLAEDSHTDAVSVSRPEGKITFENVSFHYVEEDRAAIDQITLNIRGNGLVGIIGRNGSGKTTLLKLAQGLYPASHGRVLLDGADVAQFSRAQLSSWIGYVPQECILFTGSIRDNIAQRDPDATEEQILEAAKRVGVHSYIIDLPDGYDTQIGEAGANLSAGIRQRIAIARALIGDPPVILLDEPSSNLDLQAQEELKNALVSLKTDHTILLVTHSRLFLSACGHIVALDAGRITKGGPAGEVLRDLADGQRKTIAMRRPA